MSTTAAVAANSLPYRRYPSELREMAYQYWAFTADRNAAKVSEKLAAEWQDAWGTPPTFPAFAQTVSEWAKKGNWAARVRTDLAAIAPDIEGQIVTEWMLGALEGARALRRVLRGEEEGPDARTKVIAAQVALDRFGFDPKTVNDRILRVTSAGEQRLSSAALLDLTPDELTARLAALTAGDVVTVTTTDDDDTEG